MLPISPYSIESTNIIYNLLFCDDLNLYKDKTEDDTAYPFNLLFSPKSSVTEFQQIIDDPNTSARSKILAYNNQLKLGFKPARKDLMAVIVELGLDDGLDVLASYRDGTARYINQSGKILIWETRDDQEANQLTATLFANAMDVVTKIGPWDDARRPQPATGTMRITFLVSDGLYFGEGPINVLFNDALAQPTLNAATELMQYLTEKTLQNDL
ncbi:MAG: hypothetical protein WAT92_25085 [Saprospiraceae bacterium]